MNAKNLTPSLKSAMALIGGCIAVIIIGYLLDLFYYSDIILNEPLHSSIEAIGALASLLMGIVLFMRQAFEDDYRHLWMIPGLFTIGVLDGFHAVAATGNNFVLLHSSSMFFGGLFFSFMWFPKIIITTVQVKRMTWIVVSVFTMFSIWILSSPETMPIMIQEIKFTQFAVFLNISAGVLFLVGAVFSLKTFYKTMEKEFFWFTCFSLLLALGGITFMHGNIWTISWWFWHALRLGAFMIALFIVIKNYQKNVSTLKTTLVELKQSGEELNFNNIRIKALLKMNQMKDASTQEVIDFALDKGIKFTKSKLGFIAFLNEDETVATMRGWSKSAMKQDIFDDKPVRFLIEESGAGGNAVHKRRAVLTNDYSELYSSKKGYLEDHLEISHYMEIPVFDGEKIVIVAAVANKEDEYDESDIRQLTLFMDGVWKLYKRKQNEHKIMESLQEKEILLKEIHHRIKNNMQVITSLLNLQRTKIKDDEAREQFIESENRIRSMALVHEKLYQSTNMASINFEEYIHKLIKEIIISSNINSNKIKSIINVKDIYLGLDRAIPCGLIITELITNSLKHAFPGDKKGEIKIELKKDKKGNHALTVNDNGTGIPENTDLKNIGSLGFTLLKALVKQIKGEMEITGNKGTKVTITFTGG